MSWSGHSGWAVGGASLGQLQHGGGSCNMGGSYNMGGQLQHGGAGSWEGQQAGQEQESHYCSIHCHECYHNPWAVTHLLWERPSQIQF